LVAARKQKEHQWEKINESAAAAGFFVVLFFVCVFLLQWEEAMESSSNFF
jgi:hypothetical protein